MIIVPAQFHSQLKALDKVDQKLHNNLHTQQDKENKYQNNKQKEQKEQKGRGILRKKIYNDDFDYNKHLEKQSSYLSQLFKETIEIMNSNEKLNYPVTKVNFICLS